jgi:anaerobic magnesium-protoporphyrin IX monomethyl ester cyclase
MPSTAGNPSLQQIPGITYRDGEAIIKTARRPVTRDLDSLPTPAWDLLDISPYRSAWLKSSGYFSLNVGTTRGCPFKCNWCAKPIYGNRYNSRSPENVVKELVYLKQQFAFDHIWFCDDIFGLKPGWVHEFATQVQAAGLQFRFKIQSRADLLVQENYVSSLAEAGCDNVWMGAESGSQRILDAMDKGITVAQIGTATALLKKHAYQAFLLSSSLDICPKQKKISARLVAMINATLTAQYRHISLLSPARHRLLRKSKTRPAGKDELDRFK